MRTVNQRSVLCFALTKTKLRINQFTKVKKKKQQKENGTLAPKNSIHRNV